MLLDEFEDAPKSKIVEARFVSVGDRIWTRRWQRGRVARP